MITEYVFDFILNTLSFIISLFPELTINLLDDMTNVADVAAWFKWANYYLPLDSSVDIAGTVLGLWASCSAVRVGIDLF